MSQSGDILLNELVKQGSTNGSLVGSKIIVDSAKHMTQVSRMTLDSGISLSTYGLDLNHSGSIQNAKEIFVETLHVKHLDVTGTTPLVPPTPPPAPEALPAAIELPDDMMLESLQVNNSVQIVGLSHGNSPTSPTLLQVDANGMLLTVPPAIPRCVLSTTDQNHLVWIPIPSPPPPQPPPPPPPVVAVPNLEGLIHVQVAIPDHLPRFISDTVPTLSSTSVKVDEADNMTGVNKFEALEVNVAEVCHADQIHASIVHTPVLNAQKLILGTHTPMTTILYEKNMYVSNGPFQPIGLSGEGMYLFNLKIDDNTFSLYGTFAVGKTKVAFRTSFGASLGGVKSTQLEEHESEGGFDYVICTLPDVGKIYFGVEQKTAEIVVKTDQEQLINMDIYVQKTNVAWNRKK